MLHLILLASWACRYSATHWWVRAISEAIAISLLCLSCYWFGAAEYTTPEISSSVAVSLLGTGIGVGIRHTHTDKTPVSGAES